MKAGLPSLYDVTIHHVRQAPLRNSFRYRSFMWCFDLDDPPRLKGPLRLLGRYDPGDHLDVVTPLRTRGLDVDRVVVLTNLRVFGYVFNPITVYWCYQSDGRPAAQVVEVHNTYGGRVAYELPASGPADDVGWEVTKRMYVSPFHPVDGTYRIRMSPPGETVALSVELGRPGSPPFRADMAGRRQPATLVNVVRRAVHFPLGPLRVRTLIQWQGIRVWLKGLEVQPR